MKIYFLNTKINFLNTKIYARTYDFQTTRQDPKKDAKSHVAHPYSERFLTVSSFAFAAECRGYGRFETFGSTTDLEYLQFAA